MPALRLRSANGRQCRSGVATPTETFKDFGYLLKAGQFKAYLTARRITLQSNFFSCLSCFSWTLIFFKHYLKPS